MGILDDAIREHLEFKRRHGAADGEVERLEKEAFGPILRRGEVAPEPQAEAQPEAEPEAEAVFEAEAVSLPEPEPVLEAEPEPVPAPEPEPEPEPAEPPPAPEPHSQETVEHAVIFEDEASGPPEDPLLDMLPDDEPPEPVTAVPPAPEPGEQDLDFGFDEPEPDEAEEGEAEEILEETPEFLQDNPDHDRLWFEQRPPKDFDF